MQWLRPRREKSTEKSRFRRLPLCSKDFACKSKHRALFGLFFRTLFFTVTDCARTALPLLTMEDFGILIEELVSISDHLICHHSKYSGSSDMNAAIVSVISECQDVLQVGDEQALDKLPVYVSMIINFCLSSITYYEVLFDKSLLPSNLLNKVCRAKVRCQSLGRAILKGNR